MKEKVNPLQNQEVKSIQRKVWDFAEEMIWLFGGEILKFNNFLCRRYLQWSKSHSF